MSFDRDRIAEELSQNLGPEFVRTRSGPVANQKLTYISIQTAKALADEVFGYQNWSTEVKWEHADALESRSAPPGEQTFCFHALSCVRVTLADGTYREDVGCGSSNGTTKEDVRIEALLIAKADATKRTLRQFGNALGNCLYSKQFTKFLETVWLTPQRWKVTLFKSLRMIKGVVFDMDGTLCLPQKYMFSEMREALGITKSTDILDHVHSLPEPAQEEAQEKLRDIERRGMLKMEPQPGLGELMDYIVSRRLPTTILTRNFPIPVEYLRQNFLQNYKMDPIVTREFKPPKPAPDGLFLIAKAWGVQPAELVMVGDSIDDILAGHRAGAVSVLLRNEHNAAIGERPETDYVIDSLPGLIPVLEKIST